MFRVGFVKRMREALAREAYYVACGTPLGDRFVDRLLSSRGQLVDDRAEVADDLGYAGLVKLHRRAPSADLILVRSRRIVAVGAR